MHPFIHTYYIYVCLHVCMCILVCMNVKYICIYVCKYGAYVYIHTYKHAHVHTHIYLYEKYTNTCLKQQKIQVSTPTSRHALQNYINIPIISYISYYTYVSYYIILFISINIQYHIAERDLTLELRHALLLYKSYHNEYTYHIIYIIDIYHIMYVISCHILLTHCKTSQQTAKHCSTPQHPAAHLNALPKYETHCNAPQHTATHRNTLRYI